MAPTRHPIVLLVGLAGCLALAATACSDDGTMSADTGCPDSSCLDAGGRDIGDLGADVPDVSDDSGDLGGDVQEDAPFGCEPLTDRICFDQTSYRVCNSAGTGYNDPVECGQFQTCEDGRCLDPEACRPGPIGCADDDTVLVCQDNGFLTEEADCDDGLVCFEGRCMALACRPDTKSYIGCEFWAVDLDNDRQAASRPVAVTISNFNDDDVEITLINQTSFADFTETVRAGRVRSFLLQNIQLESTELSRSSYQITADLPVTIHQFNPQNNNQEVYSNDASLLLPAAALGREYVVLGWPTEQHPALESYLHGFVTIVATIDNTEVTIRPTVEVADSEDFEGIEAGGEAVITMRAGDVLSMTTLAEHGADLTGTTISATQQVAVFAGSECANVPMGVYYCDHLEQQLMPLDTWGNEFVMAKFAPRGLENDLYRIISATDDNIITTVPAIEGVDGQHLDPGDVIEFTYDGDFRVFGTAPIALGQFMVGAEYSTDEQLCDREEPDDCAIPTAEACEGFMAIGDPAYLLGVPSNQFRDSYLVLTPAGYEEDWMTVVFEEGTSLTFDDEPLATDDADVVGASWRVLRLPVVPGQHSLTGSDPFGLFAYGYDCDVSYAYPGGLNLEQQ